MSAYKPTHDFDLRSRISCGLAAGAVAQLVQSLFSLNDALPLDVFVAHALVVVGIHLIIAISLGWVGGGFLWSAVIFLFPISTSLDIEDNLLVCLPLLLFLASAWFYFPRSSGVPLIAAAFGAGTGAGLLTLKSTLGSSDGGALAYQVLFIVVATGITWAAARWVRTRPALTTASTLGIGAAALALATTASLLHGLGRPHPPPNVKAGANSPAPVVLVVLDTLRFDHLDVFGYSRRTSPNLAKFASEPGVISTRSIANAPSSLPSHASIFTGLYPVHHGAHKPTLADPSPPAYAYPLRDDIPTLASVLSDAGYWTVGVSSNFGPLGPAFGLERGFDSYDAERAATSQLMLESPWVPRGWATNLLRELWLAIYLSSPFASSDLLADVDYRRAGTITDLGIDAIDAAEESAFFLFLNYFDPHLPYRSKRSFKQGFPGWDPKLRTSTLPPKIRYAILRGERDLSKRERSHLVSLYDREVAYLDRELGRLFDRLRAHPRYDEMLIIVTSDHGEAFGEHRHLEHSNSLYSEVLDVPLLVKTSSTSGKAAEALRSGVAQSADLFPSILDHASLPIPNGIDGFAWARGRTHALAWLFPQNNLADTFPDRFNRELQSVQSEDWKLIRSSTGEIELYKLDTQARERTSVAAQHPEKVKELISILDPYIDYRADNKPSGDKTLSEETLQRLRSLGYVP